MTGKKTKRADLERRRLYHFTIGLILSISVVVVAFEWRSPVGIIDIPDEEEEFVLLPPIPNTVHLPPKPKVLPTVVEVPDDEEPDVDIEFIIDIPINDPIPEIEDFDEPESEPTDVIHVTAEVQPSFPGGVEAFYQYVSKEMNYPRRAINRGVGGKVFVQFVVNKDGSLTDVEVIKGIGAGCDEEAVRVLKNAPRWNPGKQRGKPVRVRMVIPIIFKLQ